jgi:hypothetical protein
VSKIVLDRSKLLGFDVAGNLQAKVGAKPEAVVLDHSKLLGFDVAGNLQAKVGKKPVTSASKG